MSLKAFVAVNRCPLIKGAARRAAFQIADAHNEGRGDAWPSYRLMAAREGVSQKTMEFGVRQLERLGFLHVERRRGRSNYYRLNVERIASHGINSLENLDPRKIASPPSGSSVANNSGQSTEAGFGRGQKTASAKSSNNHIEQTYAPVSDPDKWHEGRLRKDWARDLRYFRNGQDRGGKPPFWLASWGPAPNAPECRAPADLLRLFGFADNTPPSLKGENVRK